MIGAEWLRRVLEMIPVRQGDKWGALECTFNGKVTYSRWGTDEDGVEYVQDSWQVRSYTFRCACGKEFSVPCVEFRGKRVVRDCGCGASGFSGASCVMAFSTNKGVEGHVKELARFDGQSVSYVINEALRRYFESRGGQTNGQR